MRGTAVHIFGNNLPLSVPTAILQALHMQNTGLPAQKFHTFKVLTQNLDYHYLNMFICAWGFLDAAAQTQYSWSRGRWNKKADYLPAVYTGET